MEICQEGDEVGLLTLGWLALWILDREYVNFAPSRHRNSLSFFLSGSWSGFSVAPPLSAREPVLDTATAVAPTALAASAAAAALVAASVAAPSALSSPFATTAASLT